MRMVIDAQLPARLAHHLRRRGLEVLHTSDLPLGNRTTDEELKRLSLTQAYVIVTKDGDFVDNLYQSLRQSLQKQAKLKTPSIRFPLRAGGTEWASCAVSPTSRGGTCRRAANVNSVYAIGITTSPESV